MIRQSLFVLAILLSHFHAMAQDPSSDTLDLELAPFSLPTDNVKDGFYRVETKTEYIALQNTINTVPGKAPFKYDYPRINFKKYILMGGVFHFNSCEAVTLEERLYELKSKQKIIYKLHLIQIGQCQESVLIKRWILVRKKDGYTYQFDNRIVEVAGTKE